MPVVVCGPCRRPRDLPASCLTLMRWVGLLGVAIDAVNTEKPLRTCVILSSLPLPSSLPISLSIDHSTMSWYRWSVTYRVKGHWSDFGSLWSTWRNRPLATENPPPSGGLTQPTYWCTGMHVHVYVCIILTD